MKILESKEAITKLQASIIAVIIVIVIIASAYYLYIYVPPAPAPKEIRIGIVAPTTGPASEIGRDMWQASKLAAKEINDAGGVYVEELGDYLNISLFLGDTESSRDGGIRAVTKLIVDDQVHILVGGFSSAITMADSVVAIEHGMPFIVTGASTPDITRRTDYDTSNLFHHIATADVFGRRTMIWANESLRPKLINALNLASDYELRVAIVYQDTFYGIGAFNGAVKAVGELGLLIDLVYNGTFPMHTTDFSALLPEIAGVKPDFIYHVGFPPETSAFIIQARRDFGIDTLIAAVECCDDPDYYTALGDWGDYSILQARWSTYTVPKGPTEARINQFKEAYDAMWHMMPSMMAVANYEGVYVAAKAIEEAGSLDKDKIIAALDALSMPQICELIEDGKIDYTSDYRELKIIHFMQQLYYNATIGEPRPKVIWPSDYKETGADLTLPTWYTDYLSP
jgi:branched-chain amino acid transport system substrate-binding protein